jgi:aspartokinase
VLQSSLDVEVDNHLSVISIKYGSRSADEAVTVVNAILQQYTEAHADPASANSSSKEVVAVIKKNRLRKRINCSRRRRR